MDAIESQNLTRLEDLITETNLVAMIRQEPDDISKVCQIEFCLSYDDLDYLVFSTLLLPSGDRLGLIRHKNSPTSGIEVCVRHNQSNIEGVLQAAIAEMNLVLDDFTWIHPDYEQKLRFSIMDKGRNQHVVPYEKGWAVKSEGSKRATEVFSTQQEAINRAKEIAKNQKSELFIHNKQGQIRVAIIAD